MVNRGEIMNVQGAFMNTILIFKSQYLQMVKNYKF